MYSLLHVIECISLYVASDHVYQLVNIDLCTYIRKLKVQCLFISGGCKFEFFTF